jgi:hypothetical protein
MMPPENGEAVLIVEDSQAYFAAARMVSESPAWRSTRIRWATHAPHLWEALPRAGVTPIVMDAEVTQTQADAVGYAALDASRDIASYLDSRPVAGWPSGTAPGWPLRHVLHRAISAYMYKAYLLARLRAKLGQAARIVAVGTPSAAPVTGYNVMPNRFDTLFTVLANRIGLPVVAHSSVRPTGAMENGDYMRASLWSRLTTMLNAPVSSVAYRAWGRLSRRRPAALPFLRRRGVVVAIIAGNELVEDTFLELLLGGTAVMEAPPLDVRAVPGDDPDPDVAAKVGELAIGRFRDLAADDPRPFAAAADEIAERTAAALRFGAAVARVLPDYVGRLRSAAGGRPLAVLSNAMSDGPGNLLRDALRKARVPVLVAEHGVAPGLSTLHDAQMSHERPADLEDTMFWTPVQKEHAVAVAKLRPERAIVTGLPMRLRRIGGAALQRRVVRWQLGLRRRCVAWCTGLYPNNMQYLPHYWRDTPYHSIRRDVVDTVLAGLDCDVLLKLYPTYRYTDPDPLSDGDTLPANVQVQQFTDFRSLRAAADVIMIDGPGSILGWCWDIDKPLIFFETGMYTLLDDVREAFRKSVFYVDVREPDWKPNLREILALPLYDIRRRFEGMRAERSKLGARCILGPEGSPGKRAAEFVVRRAVESASLPAT